MNDRGEEERTRHRQSNIRTEVERVTPRCRRRSNCIACVRKPFNLECISLVPHRFYSAIDLTTKAWRTPNSRKCRRAFRCDFLFFCFFLSFYCREQAITCFDAKDFIFIPVSLTLQTLPIPFGAMPPLLCRTENIKF